MDESVDWVTQNLSKILNLTAHNIGTGQSTTIHAEILGQGFMGVVLNPKNVDSAAMFASLTQLRSQTGWRQFKFVSPDTWNGKVGLLDKNFKAESISIDYANIQAKVRGDLCEFSHSHSHSSWLFTADTSQSKFASLEFNFCDSLENRLSYVQSRKRDIKFPASVSWVGAMSSAVRTTALQQITFNPRTGVLVDLFGTAVYTSQTPEGITDNFAIKKDGAHKLKMWGERYINWESPTEINNNEDGTTDL